MQLAFQHLQTCRELTKTMKAFSNKLEEIRAKLNRFTTKMLDLCNGKKQVIFIFSVRKK